VTVGGIVLTAFGLTRFTTARNELTETRKLVEEELKAYRERFEQEIAARKTELNALRDELQAASRSDRESTSKALLASALIPLAERQYRASDYSGALSTYNRALQLDPDNPVVNQRLAYVYTHSGELEKACSHYEHAIEREPNFAPALAGLGFVFRRLGERVEKEMNGFSKTSENYRSMQVERDLLLNRAEDLLLQALRLSPRLVDDDGESWWGVLGGLYKRRGQIDQAIDAYQYATQVTPQSSYGFGNLALLYMKQHRRDEMIRTYQRVEQIASKEADAEQGNFWGYADLITSSFAVGKIEQARAALPIAISIAPIDSPYMLEGLVETLRELSSVLENDHNAPIHEAVRLLEKEMAQRAAGNPA
jgi:tetratricopeptide (TPR) repeat protein